MPECLSASCSCHFLLPPSPSFLITSLLTTGARQPQMNPAPSLSLIASMHPCQFNSALVVVGLLSTMRVSFLVSPLASHLPPTFCLPPYLSSCLSCFSLHLFSTHCVSSQLSHSLHPTY